MPTLVADVNIEGHIKRLASLMRSASWREFWDYLELRIVSFAEIGLAATDPDSTIWQRCQELRVILLTDNRNDDGPDSLEATIRSRNTVDSLPVFTIGSVSRLMQSGEYADEVAESLFDQLLRIDTLRGTGRLFLP